MLAFSLIALRRHSAQNPLPFGPYLAIAGWIALVWGDQIISAIFGELLMLVAGLTGGIGSGKSAASDCFISLGVPVIDADRVARLVVEPGSEALDKIAAHFGDHVIQANGNLDRLCTAPYRV